MSEIIKAYRVSDSLVGVLFQGHSKCKENLNGFFVSAERIKEMFRKMHPCECYYGEGDNGCDKCKWTGADSSTDGWDIVFETAEGRKEDGQ